MGVSRLEGSSWREMKFAHLTSRLCSQAAQFHQATVTSLDGDHRHGHPAVRHASEIMGEAKGKGSGGLPAIFSQLADLFIEA